MKKAKEEKNHPFQKIFLTFAKSKTKKSLNPTILRQIRRRGQWLPGAPSKSS